VVIDRYVLYHTKSKKSRDFVKNGSEFKKKISVGIFLIIYIVFFF